jgi:hypothetical protein
MWRDAGDAGRRKIVGSYFALAPSGGWTDLAAIDITGAGGEAVARAGSTNPLQNAAMWLQARVGDPMFVVRANKRA